MFGIMFIFTMLVALTIVIYTDTLIWCTELDLDADFEDEQLDILNYLVDHH